MDITRCVPLPGPGLVARSADLVAVTSGHWPAPLLAVLTEVAVAGDGNTLVRAAARAALGCAGQPAWACAGITADGGLAVLVCGRAAATVRVAGGPAVTLTADDSVLPVSRLFTGPAVSLDLLAGEPAVPDPRCWLGQGVVPGSGLAVTLAPGPARPGRPGVAAAALSAQADPLTAAATVLTAPAPPADDARQPPPPVLVDGVVCGRDHFNRPGARACRECGAALDQRPVSLVRRPRPPLGVLVLDDGTRLTLDGDYVLGREPALDGEVMAGRARPVRVTDPGGTVSRLHLRFTLVGWQVEVSDLGSANGSVLQAPGGERALAPFEPAFIEPGTRIGLGDRGLQYLPYQGVQP